VSKNRRDQDRPRRSAHQAYDSPRDRNAPATVLDLIHSLLQIVPLRFEELRDSITKLGVRGRPMQETGALQPSNRLAHAFNWQANQGRHFLFLELRPTIPPSDAARRYRLENGQPGSQLVQTQETALVGPPRCDNGQCRYEAEPAIRLSLGELTLSTCSTERT
jgi:hypothetical protein